MGKRMRTTFLRISLAFILAWGCIIAPGIPASADVRPDDLVAGKPVGEGHPEVPDAPNIVADYAALCAKDGTILWERDAGTAVPMASCTKIMTALVALETVSPDTMMIVTYGAAWTEGSSAGLQIRDTLPLRDLLLCMMVPSGNDAAVAIAENVSGTEFAFVKLMNAKAEQLGMRDTRFSNASGIIDEGNYTTARDYLILTRAAMSNELFRNAVTMSEVGLEISGRWESFYSTNRLLWEMDGANGIKTGFTDAAGYCLVASARRNNFEFYAIVFHSSTEAQRFVDARVLLEWGFAHYRTVELINAAIPVAELACLDWLDRTVSVVAEGPVSVNVFDYNGPITQEVTLKEKKGPIKKGEVVGSIIWTQNKEVIAHVNLVALEDVPDPGFWDGVKIWWSRLWGGFSGKPANAKSTISLPEVFDLKIANVNG